jgi:hypothetical protein
MDSARPDSTGFLQQIPSLMTPACYNPATLELTNNKKANGIESNIRVAAQSHVRVHADCGQHPLCTLSG